MLGPRPELHRVRARARAHQDRPLAFLPPPAESVRLHRVSAAPERGALGVSQRHAQHGQQVHPRAQRAQFTSRTLRAGAAHRPGADDSDHPRSAPQDGMPALRRRPRPIQHDHRAPMAQRVGQQHLVAPHFPLELPPGGGRPDSHAARDWAHTHRGLRQMYRSPAPHCALARACMYLPAAGWLALRPCAPAWRQLGAFPPKSLASPAIADHVSSRNQWHHTSQSIRSILAPPMPQTPNGSSLLPLANRNHAYSRMRSAPHTAPHTVPSRPSLPPRGTSWRLGGARPANPFH